jgi:hypothetical protein
MTTTTIHVLVTAVGDSRSSFGLVRSAGDPQKADMILVLASLTGCCRAIRAEMAASMRRDVDPVVPNILEWIRQCIE